MSTTQVNQKLTTEDAFGLMATQFHAPVFFDKLASAYGIVPQNENEAREYLLLAGDLRARFESANVKQASDRVGALAAIRAELNGTAGAAQEWSHIDQQQDAVIRKVAASAAQNPLFKEAALVLSQNVN